MSGHTFANGGTITVSPARRHVQPGDEDADSNTPGVTPQVP